MTFITKLTIQSGDREVLDETVAEIKHLVTRKGAEMKGPHPTPPKRLSVPLYKRLESDNGQFDPWDYTIFSRKVEIVGHDAVARIVATRTVPASVRVEVEVERIHAAGSRS